MARITGKNGALYVFNGSAWVLVLDNYEWEAEVETVTVDGSVKGDVFERQMPTHGRGRVRCRRYVEPGATLALANNVLNAISNGTRIDFALVSIDQGVSNFSSNPNVRVQSAGYVTRGTVRSPQRSGFEDDWEITMDVLPNLFG